MNTKSQDFLPRSAQLGITLLRISLGIMWVAHAQLKLLVFTLPLAAEFFQNHGFPGFLVYPVYILETVGGVMLILGIYGRQVSLALIPILLAAASVHIHNGWVFSNPNGGWEYPAFLLVASGSIYLVGDGAWAIRRSNRLLLSF